MKAQALIVCFLFVIAAAKADPLDHWTVTPSGLPPNVASIAYGKGKYVAVGASAPETGWLAYSTDLQHWTPAMCADQSCAPPALLSVTFAEGRFVAVGNYSWTYSSTNGVDWHLDIVPPSDSLLFDIIFADGKFVTVGEQESCPCGFVAITTQGVDWAPTFLDRVFRLRGVAFGKGTLVAVGLIEDATSNPPHNIVASTNFFETWDATVAAGANLFAVAYGNDVFVAVGQQQQSGTGCIAISTNGQIWTTASVPTTNALRSINFVQGVFVATGASGTLLSSTNGLDWSVRATSHTNSLSHPFFAGGRICAISHSADWLESDPLVQLEIGYGAQPELIVSGLEGRSYRIEARNDIASPHWDDLGSFVLYNSPTLWRDGSERRPNTRFYRAVLLP
jgi:hypothetical protein